MLRFRLHPDAAAEALEAAAFIRADDFRQADLFVRAFEDAMVWARTQPLIFRCFDGEFRKVRLGKFRYSLIFRLKDGEIQILAVMHLSRRPGYWKNRPRGSLD
jgi:toxin ParE1/3/4